MLLKSYRLCSFAFILGGTGVDDLTNFGDNRFDGREGIIRSRDYWTCDA